MKQDIPHPLRVVIVEDEPIIAMELEMMLQDLGIEIVGMATSAVEAEALASSERPDFLTMDINIKGKRDGVDAACMIYERCGIRSIFVSAHSDSETKERAGPAMPLGWVRKPANRRDLADAVKRVERRQA